MNCHLGRIVAWDELSPNRYVLIGIIALFLKQA